MFAAAAGLRSGTLARRPQDLSKSRKINKLVTAMRTQSTFISLLLLLAASLSGSPKPRLIVLTDIGGDPDDQQSMVRLMLYSNEFDIEGLIASASGTPGELRASVVRPDLIRDVVNAYGQVRDNLLRHATGYPPHAQLLERVKAGNPNRGVDNLGAAHDTEGSNWIIAAADRPDPRPVNIAIWGGATELAQALWRVRNDRGPEGIRRLLAHLRVHSIGHQDNTGPWIVDNFPGLFFILNARSADDVLKQSASGPDRRLSSYRGMYLGGDESLTSLEWLDTHVRREHGPLGALYPPKTWTAPNPHGALKEGDTPSWFYFLPRGLNDPEHPEWGGWGGRFLHAGNGLYRDTQDTIGDVTDARAAVWRWRQAFQNDFQARMDWCVTPPLLANHNPVAVVNGDATRDVLRLKVKSGEPVALSATASHDPDGHRLSFRWFLYPEPSTFKGDLPIPNPAAQAIHLTGPRVEAPQTIHLILEVKDNGAPNLFAHRRVVLEVHPSGPRP